MRIIVAIGDSRHKVPISETCTIRELLHELHKRFPAINTESAVLTSGVEFPCQLHNDDHVAEVCDTDEVLTLQLKSPPTFLPGDVEVDALA